MTEVSEARSRAATVEAECAVVAVRKELEDTLATARAEGLMVWLQAPEAKRAKAEEAAKASAESSTVHLGQLQKARGPARWYVFFFSYAFSVAHAHFVAASFISLVLISSCAIRAELEKELVAMRESLARTGGVSEVLGTVMSRTAQELGVVLDLEASPAVHMAVVISARQEWIRQGVRFGMHIAFWVISTHYGLELKSVSRDGPFEDFTEEDLQLIHEETHAFIEAMATKYE